MSLVHKGEKWYLFAAKCDHMAREKMKPRIHSLGSWLFVAYVQKRGIGGEHITGGEDEKKNLTKCKSQGHRWTEFDFPSRRRSINDEVLITRKTNWTDEAKSESLDVNTVTHTSHVRARTHKHIKED